MSADKLVDPAEPAVIPPLPAPRLQLRWVKADPNSLGHEWACHYELVIPLGELDIRREIYDDEGSVTKGPMEAVIQMKLPTLRRDTRTPCQYQDGARYYDPPFRDGAHAAWDAAVLGNPPIYVIAPDGVAFKRHAEFEHVHGG